MTQQFDEKSQINGTDQASGDAAAPVSQNGGTSAHETVSDTTETVLSAPATGEELNTTTSTEDTSPTATEATTLDAETAATPASSEVVTAPEESTLDTIIAAAQPPILAPVELVIPEPIEAAADETPQAELVSPEPQQAASEDASVAVEAVAQPTTPPQTTTGGKSGPGSLMDQIFNEKNTLPPVLKRGEVREGVVAFKSSGEILVDVNAKSEGTVPAREFQQLSAEDFANMKVGDSVLVYVVQPENQEGVPVLSIDKTLVEKAWRRLQTQFEAGDTIEATVSDFNKGGVLVELGGVRGFVPSSQISRLVGASEASRQADMQRLINTRLPLKIIEIDRPRNRLILSERQAVQEQRDLAKDRIMTELEEGQVRDGIVASIADFGAFVDIGGIDGLVHLSELSWSRVSRPQDVVRVGDKVKVVVLSVDKNTRKVALSIKQAQPEPWSRVMAQYQQGQVVQGTITQIANFGAFARIADGVEGLIHVSELAEGRVAHPRDVVKDGDVVNVKIIRIDPERRRMGLSIRQAAQDGYESIIGGPTFVAQQARQNSDGVAESTESTEPSDVEAAEPVTNEAPVQEEAPEVESPVESPAQEEEAPRAESPLEGDAQDDEA